jgi:hypothetical protein
VVDRVDGFSPGETATYPEMSLSITYVGDAPEGHFVNTTVTDPEGRIVASTLFQFTSGDEIRTSYAGGHGFTGLHYAYNDDAQLTFWCSG